MSPEDQSIRILNKQKMTQNKMKDMFRQIIYQSRKNHVKQQQDSSDFDWLFFSLNYPVVICSNKEIISRSWFIQSINQSWWNFLVKKKSFQKCWENSPNFFCCKHFLIWWQTHKTNIFITLNDDYHFVWYEQKVTMNLEFDFFLFCIHTCFPWILFYFFVNKQTKKRKHSICIRKSDLDFVLI